MNKAASFRFLMLVAWIMMLSKTAAGQCPDKPALWKRILFLKDSSQSSVSDKLKELLKYEEQVGECPHPDDSVHAYLLQRIGVMYYKQADYRSAIQFTRKAIGIISSNRFHKDINYARAVGCYFNLQIYFDSLRLISQKHKAIDSCIALAVNLHAVDQNVLFAMIEKAGTLFKAGDYHRCVEFASMAETVAAEAGLAHEEKLKGILTWKINSLLFLQQYDEAEKILAGKLSEYEKTKEDVYVGTVFSLLAKLAKVKGDFQKSISYYHKGFQNNLRIGFAEGCAESLSNIGFVYFEELHQPEKAIPFYRQALKFANAKDSINILDNLAIANSEQHRYDAAFYFFQKAFDRIKPGITETGLLVHTNDYVTENITEYVISLVLDKGDTYLSKYREAKDPQALTAAINTYKTADLLLQRVKLTQYETESKLFWRSHARRLYDQAVEACYLAGNNDDAFYFFEKSRAVLLNDQLNEQNWLNEAEILQRSALEKKLASMEAVFQEDLDNSKKNSSQQQEIFNTREELAALQDRIREKNPLYFQNFVDTSFIAIHDVQQKILSSDQSLIELFSGDSAVFEMVIDASGSYLAKIDKVLFDSLSSAITAYLSNEALINSHFPEFLKISNGLYRLLFKGGSLISTRVIISPGGKYFPFDALVSNQSPLQYFIDKHAVSYTYSARYLLNDFEKKKPAATANFVGFAPVRFSNGLPGLPGSEESIRRMQSYFSGASGLTGPVATKNNFMTKFYNYRVIELCTHATDSNSAGEPMIYFSDSALRLSELLPENMPATELIILSACQTASGKVYNGEGVFSFNRSFAALGIPSSLSNLWEVDNESTYQLTELFCKYVSVGLPLDVALQKAKNEYRKEAVHDEDRLPSHWSAQVLVGKTNAIVLKKRFSWLIAGWILLSFLCLGGIWAIVRNRMLKN